MLDNRQLAVAARRAYERGRLKRGVLEALPVLPMTALSLVGTSLAGLNLLLGVLLAVAVVGMVWRGGGLARGVHPGLVAGALFIVVPVLGRQCAYICIGPACWSTCVLACAAAGVGAGTMLARSWRKEGSPEKIGASLGIATLAGAMGCLEIGAAGLAAAAAMLLASSLGVTAAQR